MERATFLAALLASAVFLVACGDDGASSPDTDASSQSASRTLYVTASGMVKKLGIT